MVGNVAVDQLTRLPVAEPVSEPPTPMVIMPFGRGIRFSLSLGAGITAGALAFVALVAMARNSVYFPLPDEVVPLLDKPRLSDTEADVISQAMRMQAYQNTALAVAVFGAVVGGLLGFAAGVTRKSPLASSAGLLGGLVAGAGAGAVGGLVDLYALERLWDLQFDHTYKAMIAHTSAFLIAGVGIGASAGLAGRQVAQTLGVVLAAGLIAGLIYPGLAAALFPILNTDAAVPDGVLALLLWTTLPAGLMGLAVGRTQGTVLPTVTKGS